ncbi:MAG TPA: metallopeptidase family protein [Caulobacteraceae bacterium]|jgi:predicted Zn-dependent protease with MMP-like domain
MNDADWSRTAAPSLDAFAAIAERAWGALPETFRAMAGDVVLQVADWPDGEMLDELGIEDAYELTGLYQGVDLTRRSLFDPTPPQSMVFLFRRPILDEWCELGDVALGELITHVLVHEVGHHFGLSDEAMAAIETRA